MQKQLTFSLTNKTGADDFAKACAALNANGVPFSVSNDGQFLTVEISTGY